MDYSFFYKRLPLCLLLILNSVLPSSSICHLQDYHLQNEWRVVLEFKEGELKLLRQRTVQNGSVLYMVCNVDDVIEIACENGQFNGQLPPAPCYSPMKPQLKPEADRSLCAHQLYRVGFNIRCRDSDYFFETYKVCFDHHQMRAIFTISEAYPYVHSRPRGMQFDPDEIFTLNIFAAYNKRDIYGRFQSLLGTQQSFMSPNEGDRRIDRGHLTPVGDFMTNTLISSTFKMINVIPQFHTINDGNWKQMEEWARNPINTPCKVCSGAFHWVLELPDSENRNVAMYLRENRIPIPLWTFKVVLNRHGVRTAFVQYNNIHDIRQPPQIPGDICRTVGCPSSISLSLSNYVGYTYCCEEGHFMSAVVPHLQGYC